MPPFAVGKTPVTPVVSGNPVRLVATPAEGVPIFGVTSVGDVAKTAAPVPVSSVNAPRRFALEGVAKNVATLVPSPDTPVLIGKPVALVKTPLEGVPSAGVTSVGDVANTAAPVPVSSVNALRRFALDGVAKNVATPVPSPETPVEIGSPVPFVNTIADGVPSAGVTSVGDVANTSAPVPVSSVTAAIRFALDGVASHVAIPVPKPLTPVEIGKPVALVSVPLAGVPRAGAIRVGPLFNTTVLPVPVVVAALIAVPLPAKTGLFMEVVSVIAGVDVAFATVPAKPFAVTTETVETVPPPEK